MRRWLPGLAASAVALLASAAPAGAQEPPAPQRVLVTGDSLMYVMQQPLARRLRHRGFQVSVDSRVGTGLTKPWLTDWVDLAQAQVKEVRPDVTFVFIGGNDGYGIGGERCCGPRGVRTAAARAEQSAAI